MLKTKQKTWNVCLNKWFTVNSLLVNVADGFVIVLYISSSHSKKTVFLILILTEQITLRAHFCAFPSQHFMINCLFNIAAEHKLKPNNHTVISIIMSGGTVYHQRYQITFSQEVKGQKQHDAFTPSYKDGKRSALSRLKHAPFILL